jgi:hypothetical protein
MGGEALDRGESSTPRRSSGQAQNACRPGLPNSIPVRSPPGTPMAQSRPCGLLTLGSDQARRCFGRFSQIRRLLILLVVLSALAVTSAASARVRPVSLTSPIRHGAYATLSVAVSPAATCSITVIYKSGRSSAAGLYPKRGSRISWTWKGGRARRPAVGRSSSRAGLQARCALRSLSDSKR